MANQVFVRRKATPTQQEGPFPEEEFLRQLEVREILFGDFAWITGSTDWVLAGSLALYLKRRGQPARPARAADEPPQLDRPSGQLSGGSLRDFLLRMDRVRIHADLPAACVEVLCPLHVVLCGNPNYPGGKAWRRIASELTQLLAARVRFEQAALLHAHPIRALLPEKGFVDPEAAEEGMALAACEELKRRVVNLGADLLVRFDLRFDFISETQSGRPAGSVPIVSASGLAGLTEGAAAARKARALPATTEAVNPEGNTALSNEMLQEIQRQLAEMEEKRRNIEERETYLADAEARVMSKMEEQQVREAELEHRAEQLQRKAVAAGLEAPVVEPREKL